MLVTESSGICTFRSVIRTPAARNRSVIPLMPRWGREMSNVISRPLASRASLPSAPFLIFFQFMIPALTFIHIHKNRLQQAHSHHKYRIPPDQILRKLQIIISQFIIITDSCIFPGIRHQQPEDTVCIIVCLVHSSALAISPSIS